MFTLNDIEDEIMFGFIKDSVLNYIQRTKTTEIQAQMAINKGGLDYATHSYYSICFQNHRVNQ